MRGIISAIAGVLFTLPASAQQSDVVTGAKKVADFCSSIAVTAREPKMYDYCLLEAFSRIVSGANCASWAPAFASTRVRCDADGALYMQPLSVTHSRALSKQETADLFSEIVQGHTLRRVVSCILKAKDDLGDREVCFAAEKAKLKVVFSVCSNEKVGRGSTAARALDKCIERKVK